MSNNNIENNNNMFVNMFITELVGCIDGDSIRTVRDKLSVFINDYDIKQKSTDVILYEGYLPYYYKIFFATMKIDGLKNSTLELYNMYLKDFFLE